MNFIDKLLRYYEISQDDYTYLTRDISFDTYHIPREFQGMKEVSDQLKKHIQNGEKVMIYGDYDTDGIMSTSILVRALEELKAQVGYYIPSRYLDGYGMSLEKAQEIAQKGYQVVILIDNGVTVFEPISYLKDKGITVIVIDHHEMIDKLPRADYILHPDLSHYGKTPVCAGYLAYLFSIYLLERYDYKLALMAAVATIGDMMPLREYNRDLLRSVFKSYRLGLFSAFDTLNEGLDFDESGIGSRISPKINAVGRVVKDTTINRLVRYFVTDDKELISKYALWINDINAERKALSEGIVASVESMEREEAYVLKYDIQEGLLGIIANTILRKFNVPVVCFAQDSVNSGCLKGSIRTPAGYDVMEIFTKLSQYLVSSGGHTSAGGLSIRESDFSDFSRDFKVLVKGIEVEEVEEKVIDVNITEITLENYYLLNKLSPFGIDWEQPLFRLERVKASSLEYSRSGEHIISRISIHAKFIGFGYTKEMLSHYNYIDIYGNYSLSEYRGVTSLDFMIKDIKESL
ncbi:MAG: DHH family phosphoesterase [Coprobacillus sp.]|nr:DHH family phosphoesterase [Coprobacillus sp.]